jgi:predicted thioesterase
MSGRLEAGLTASLTAEVTDADTAEALGSGDVPVLGTPRLLALAEAATVAAISSALDPGQTTVGISVSLEHSRASLVGTTVEVRAELADISGRRLRFNFIAYGPGGDDAPVLGAGTVERVLVDRDSFLARAAAG